MESRLATSLTGTLAAVQTADSGSFTAAARVLDLTPAAVAKGVAVLEAQLGVRLFNRTTRRLSPTEEGRRFLAQAREGLHLLAEAGAAAGAARAPEGLVRVSCSAAFGRQFVLPALPAFYAAFPAVQVELNLADAQVDLVAEGFDIGIRGGAAPPQGMVARPLCSVPSLLVASPAYLRAHGTPQRAAELGAHRLIGLRFQSGRSLPWVFAQGRGTVALEPAVALAVSDPGALVDAALAGLGIAPCAQHHAWDALQAGRLVRVLPRAYRNPPIEMALFYPHRRGLAQRVRVLAEHLLAVLPAQPALAGR